MRRYNWLSAGSLGWPFPMLKYKYIFRMKYTEAILSNSTLKLLRFEILWSKCWLQFKEINLLSSIRIFGTPSFPTIFLSSSQEVLKIEPTGYAGEVWGTDVRGTNVPHSRLPTPITAQDRQTDFVSDAICSKLCLHPRLHTFRSLPII